MGELFRMDHLQVDLSTEDLAPAAILLLGPPPRRVRRPGTGGLPDGSRAARFLVRGSAFCVDMSAGGNGLFSVFEVVATGFGGKRFAFLRGCDSSSPPQRSLGGLRRELAYIGLPFLRPGANIQKDHTASQCQSRLSGIA